MKTRTIDELEEECKKHGLTVDQLSKRVPAELIHRSTWGKWKSRENKIGSNKWPILMRFIQNNNILSQQQSDKIFETLKNISPKIAEKYAISEDITLGDIMQVTSKDLAGSFGQMITEAIAQSQATAPCPLQQSIETGRYSGEVASKILSATHPDSPGGKEITSEEMKGIKQSTQNLISSSLGTVTGIKKAEANHSTSAF